MHSLLYVCIPRKHAHSSLEARKKVSAYLTEEGFDDQRRFSGHCDHFRVGGLWSGQLTLLRLQYRQPKRFEKIWDRILCAPPEKAAHLFKEAFPDVRVGPPLRRLRIGEDGEPDDAQILDEPLFQQLKKGFTDELSREGEGPDDVIFTTDEYVQDPEGDFPWPTDGIEGRRWWVVVIDYHF